MTSRETAGEREPVNDQVEYAVRNISGWTGAAGGFPGTVLPDQTHAAIVLSVYTLVLGGVAFWLFERRDVQGATGGG